ncbi:hypothetical protein Ssi02_14320 [Sinosporangium siamense]|uniref:Uncharacterized protein n=1 Tax=Sinosporangium siamense TaxID=1367973 RepID=A0A919V5S4_9ACTN|nr:hypothetical protein Ssi02_14320 [Sinosporangium siamense]
MVGTEIPVVGEHDGVSAANSMQERSSGRSGRPAAYTSAGPRHTPRPSPAARRRSAEQAGNAKNSGTYAAIAAGNPWESQRKRAGRAEM